MTDQQISEHATQQNPATQYPSEYDIIIVGAGSAGTLLANRLCTSSKTSGLSILILETGTHRPDDPKINTPGYSRMLQNNPDYDWCFASEQEPALSGRRIKHPRGKVVGGTSAINSHSLVFPSRAYHNFWNEQLLHGSIPLKPQEAFLQDESSTLSHENGVRTNSGVDWNWEGVGDCYSRPFEVQQSDTKSYKDLDVNGDSTPKHDSANFVSKQTPNVNTNQNKNDHNGLLQKPSSGKSTDKIHASLPRTVYDLQKYWIKTFEDADFFSTSYGIDGQAFGGLTILNALDARPSIGGRSHAGRAFWDTIKQCHNVTTRENVLVEKIEFSDRMSGNSGKLTASGIQLLCNGQCETVRVKSSGEVILCAGVFKSPQILELSGIGAKDTLANADIKCIYDLPGVGENLQDHLNCGCSVELKDGIPSRDVEDRDEVLQRTNSSQYEKDRQGPLADGIHSFAHVPSQWLSTDDEQKQLEKAMAQSLNHSSSDNTSTVSAGTRLQHEFIKTATQNPKEATATLFLQQRQRHPDLDTLPATEPKVVPGNYFSIVAMLSYPFSRGSCHAISKDTLTHPRLNFNYLSHPLDKAQFRTHLRQIDRLMELAPLSHVIKPNGRRLPRSFPRKFTDASDAELDEMLKSTVATNYHPCGTCAMMREELGGVVDETFMVYGTANVRVVDASVFPIIPRGNILTTVYALAEKAAEVLLDDFSSRISQIQ